MAGNLGGGGSGFQMSLEMLETFEKSLEGLLEELTGGPEPVARSTELALREGDLGQDFHESAWMGAALQETSARVQQFIGTLHDQIAAMKMSVGSAAGATGGMDDEKRRELNSIMERLRQNTQSPPVAGGTSPAGQPSKGPVNLG
jgi:hypothetical protein